MLLEAVDVGFAYRRAATDRRAVQAAAVDGVSLSIDRGDLVAILGPNGSGKTTLIRLLCGALQPTRGVVRMSGRDLRRLARREVARAVAVVPQETQLAFDYSVLEVVLMGRYPHLGAFEVEGPRDLAAAFRALETTGTLALADRPFQTLSGGEKQRVVIASALAQVDDEADVETRLLFLDEPTASLDVKYQIEVASLVRGLHERGQATVVLTTHDLRWAATVCTRVVLLSGGRVLAQGSPADVLTQDAVAALYGIDAEAAAPLVGR